MSDHGPDEDFGEPFTAEELAALRDAPPSVVILNHAFNLLQLATIHLAAEPPNLPEAAIVIDAVGGLLKAVEGRLPEGEELLTEALSQIRLVFVRASAQPSA